MSDATTSAPAADLPPGTVKRPRGRPRGSGPPRQRAAASSDRARLVAAVVLDVLGGNRSPQQAAQALGLSVARYYVIEQHAIAGLVSACEPRPKGPPGPDLERQLAAAQAENRRLAQTVLRQQALVRAGQRSLGITAPRQHLPGPDGKPVGATAGKGRRRRRTPSVRALRVAQRLDTAPAVASPTPAPGQTGGDRSGGQGSPGMDPERRDRGR